MASFFHKPILAVVYISSIFLTVSSINVYKVAAPTTKDVNDPQPPFTAGPAACPGPPGPPGAQGPAGVSGPRGNRGFDGNNGYDGDTGPAGPDGVSGPKGDKGDDGLKGEKGDQGDPGTPYTPPPTIAFVAHLTTNFHLSSGSKIIAFQTMKLNIGDDFSPTSGVFTCRIPGLYYFAFNLHPAGVDDRVLVDLEHNGVPMARLYTPGTTNYYSAFSTSSHSTILALVKGDEVLLRADAPTDIHGGTSPYSTFTGYLLQETTSPFISNLNSE